jgi:hypothetical protein
MAQIKTVPGLLNHFNASDQRIRVYFQHLPALVQQFPLDVCLSYAFSRVELAHNTTLYCGVVKLHKAHTDLAWRAVQGYHMTRDAFRESFRTIFGVPLPSTAVSKIQQAESVRDAVMHGKRIADADKRNAVARVLDYGTEMNSFIHEHAGFRPFGDLRGFKGSAKPLDKSTTRWILKGMGFTIS